MATTVAVADALLWVEEVELELETVVLVVDEVVDDALLEGFAEELMVNLEEDDDGAPDVEVDLVEEVAVGVALLVDLEAEEEVLEALAELDLTVDVDLDVEVDFEVEMDLGVDVDLAELVALDEEVALLELAVLLEEEEALAFDTGALEAEALLLVEADEALELIDVVVVVFGVAARA